MDEADRARSDRIPGTLRQLFNSSMAPAWRIAQPYCVALAPQINSPEPLWYIGCKVMTGEDKLCESPSLSLTQVPSRGIIDNTHTGEHFMETSPMCRVLTCCSLLTDVLREQLHRLVAMDEDATECIEYMLCDLRIESELLRVCARQRFNLGRHPI